MGFDKNNISAVILAGGLSSRMGRNKAELEYRGESFISRQVKLVRSLGIADIIISGYDKPIAATRFAPDIYPLRGPLGGIHGGLLEARNDSVLVLSVDTPLITPELLKELLAFHEGGITVLEHGGELEPLIGVYDRALIPLCEEILKGDNSSIRRLFKACGYRIWPYAGDEALLSNCNTPEDYKHILNY